MVESVYNALNLLFTWFALANFYIFFVSPIGDDDETLRRLGHFDKCPRRFQFRHSAYQYLKHPCTSRLNIIQPRTDLLSMDI